MDKTKRLRGPASLLMVMALSVGSMMLVVPARADTSCPDGKVCLWENSSYGGCKLVKDADTANLSNNDPCGWGGDGFNDDTSSAKSRKNHATTLCGDSGFGGGISANLAAGVNITQVPNNDTASSYKNSVINCTS